MAHEEAAKSGAGMKLVIRNIGVLLSGDRARKGSGHGRRDAGD
jgi:hypothetical protein